MFFQAKCPVLMHGQNIFCPKKIFWSQDKSSFILVRIQCRSCPKLFVSYNSILSYSVSESFSMDTGFRSLVTDLLSESTSIVILCVIRNRFIFYVTASLNNRFIFFIISNRFGLNVHTNRFSLYLIADRFSCCVSSNSKLFHHN